MVSWQLKVRTNLFQGHLDGRDVAIKRFDCPLSLEYVPGFFELAKLDHVNVIKYLGCCIEEETILVYEYNKDARIDAFFCGTAPFPPIDWKSFFRSYSYNNPCTLRPFQIVKRDLI